MTGNSETNSLAHWRTPFAPAFRRACTLDSPNVVKIARALVESTLVVSTDSLMPLPRFFTAVDIRWQREFSPGQNVEYAIAAILSHLSQRTMRRLNCNPPRSKWTRLPGGDNGLLMSRILLSAYACEPGKGSEPAVGWMWATELAAAGHEVCVITREANRSVHRSRRAFSCSLRLHFQYCDLPRLGARLEETPRRHLSLLLPVAVDGISPGTKAASLMPLRSRSSRQLRQPASAQLHGMARYSFLLGPSLRRRMCSPALRRVMTRPGRALEIVRDCANRLTRFDPLMRTAFRRAEQST